MNEPHRVTGLTEGFPVLGSKTIKSIPWAMIAPHDERAQRSHKLSLYRLAQRGGLSVGDAVDVLDERPWSLVPRYSYADYHTRLADLVEAWETKPG